MPTTARNELTTPSGLPERQGRRVGTSADAAMRLR